MSVGAEPASASSGPLADALDRFGEAVGQALSWLTLACVLVCFGVVVLRYAFNVGFIWMQESYVWLHAIVFTGCAAYTLKHDVHVRVDIFYSRMSTRSRAWVNLIGATLMVLPWMAVMAWLVVPWIVDSWSMGEGSGMPGGIPAVYLLKAMLLVMAVLLSMQAVALAARSVHTLRRP
jgi:TRAP-type mannitol/chloroaromatic compound transport system permease small subunit